MTGNGTEWGRQVARLLGAALVAGGLALAAPGAASADVAASGPAAPSAVNARVVELTNAERERAGLDAVEVEPRLEMAAQRYAETLATTGCFAHTCGPEPELPDRVESTGYVTWARLAENLAAGQRGADEAVTAWLNSAGHRANLLDPAVEELGVGYATGGPYGVYWVQVFGSRFDDEDGATAAPGQ